ncbi:MAG: AsmA family protein [Gammaproteobacteria bacterium]|nr:AsmA family protein [Gammaproteobacteria bacterium]
MGKIFKVFLTLFAGLVGLFVIAAIAVTLLFDPNDFRDEISTRVRDATGRELLIKGDLSFSIFPWLALEIGQTTLGNAEGFGEEPFVRFDSAKLSIEMLPLIFSQELSIGTVALDSFEANLSVARNGTTNWDDLVSAGNTTADTGEQTQSGSAPAAQSLDIADVRLSNASIHYNDAQSGSNYSLTDLTISTGRIAAGEPFQLDANFNFAALPGELGGSLSIRGKVTLAESLQQLSVAGLNISGELTGIVSQPTALNLESRAIDVDLDAQSLTLGEIDLAILGLAMSADVKPFSYAGDPNITATLRVADFSLKELMQTLDIAPPVTADPNALAKLSFSGNAQVGQNTLSLKDMTLVMDDTTMTGELVVPLAENGTLTFDLRADSINLDNYMAPPVENAAAEEVVDVGEIEIPVELIRALHARGNVFLDKAFLGPMTFTELQLGINSADGRLRLKPITARFFGGTYNGDVRIDASGEVPSLSVNERISGVNLQSMAATVFEAENITGTIAGNFALNGRGVTIADIRRNLNGTMAFELADGAVEGTDVWHQLRSARALYKREEPPEPSLPLRTEFSAIKATGTVTDGVFSNDDLLIELPFLRITGNGTVNLDSTEIEYSVQARVFDKPEFVGELSDDERADFTKTLIPIKIRGTLASPSFRPDVEAMFREEVEKAIEEKKDELKKELFNKILGGDQPADAAEDPDAEPNDKDKLKDRLKDLFKN